MYNKILYGDASNAFKLIVKINAIGKSSKENEQVRLLVKQDDERMKLAKPQKEKDKVVVKRKDGSIKEVEIDYEEVKKKRKTLEIILSKSKCQDVF